MLRTPAWAIFISGRGSNLGALLDVRPEMDIRLCVSSSASAYGMLRARRAGVPVMATPFHAAVDGRAPKIDWESLDKTLRAKKITHIFLAGFMKVVPASFVKAWEGCIVNLHPSLLPDYPGLNSIARAFEDRAAVGMSVHEVNEKVDAGQVLLQRRSFVSGVQGYALHSGGAALSLADLEFLLHVDEQRLVKKAASVWPVQNTFAPEAR